MLRLAARGTLGTEQTEKLWRYCAEGGIDNATSALPFAAHLIGRSDILPPPPRPMPAAGFWTRARQERSRERRSHLLSRDRRQRRHRSDRRHLRGASRARSESGADLRHEPEGRALDLVSEHRARGVSAGRGHQCDGVRDRDGPGRAWRARTLRLSGPAGRARRIEPFRLGDIKPRIEPARPCHACRPAGGRRADFRPCDRVQGAKHRTDVRFCADVAQADRRPRRCDCRSRRRMDQTEIGLARAAHGRARPCQLPEPRWPAGEWRRPRHAAKPRRRPEVDAGCRIRCRRRAARRGGDDGPAAKRPHQRARRPRNASGRHCPGRRGSIKKRSSVCQQASATRFKADGAKPRRRSACHGRLLQARAASVRQCRRRHPAVARLQHRSEIQLSRSRSRARRTTIWRSICGCAERSALTPWSISASTATSNGCPARAPAFPVHASRTRCSGPLPHLYPFIVNDPGEGIQAKRRSAAVIVDHLTPPLTRAELHDDLSRLESMVDEYALAADLDPKRATVIADDILSMARVQQIDADLGLAQRHARQRHAARARRASLRPEGNADPRRAACVRQLARSSQRTDLLVSIARMPRSDLRPEDASLHRALAMDLGLTDFDPLTRDLAEVFAGPRPAILREILDQAVADQRRHGRTDRAAGDRIGLRQHDVAIQRGPRTAVGAATGSKASLRLPSTHCGAT